MARPRWCCAATLVDDGRGLQQPCNGSHDMPDAYMTSAVVNSPGIGVYIVGNIGKPAKAASWPPHGRFR
jgi:hypothetical protein